MQTEKNYTLKRFEELDPGSVVVATLQGAKTRYFVYGTKAFAVMGDGTQVEQFVSLGPFGPNQGDVPTTHEPVVLRGPVLDITKFFRVIPSLKPESFLPDLPLARDNLGVMFLMKNHTLLGVKHSQGGDSWITVFLNLDSGELINEVPHEEVFATRRWSVIASEFNGGMFNRYDYTFGGD